MATLVDTAGLITQLWPDGDTAPSPETIARLRKQGKIPYVRLNRLIYYDPEVVRATIVRQMTNSRRSK